MTGSILETREQLRQMCGEFPPTMDQSHQVHSLIAVMTDMNMSSQLVDQAFAAAAAHIMSVQKQKQDKEAEAKARAKEKAAEKAQARAEAWGGATSYQAMIDAKQERNEEIYRDWLDGVSQAELARKHGISPERTREIILRCERIAKRAAMRSRRAEVLKAGGLNDGDA